MSYQRCLSILLCGVLSVLAGCSEDANPPRIIAEVPGNGSSTFPRDTLVRVQFNEKLRESSIPDDGITLLYNGLPVPGRTRYESSINTVTFIPDDLFFFLRQYDATLKSGISDVEGNSLVKGDDWTFRIADGVFNGAGVVEQSNTGDAIAPQIEIGANMDGIIVWSQSDGTRRNIWARPLQPGSTPDGEEMIETEDLGDADAPQVAMDGDGNAIVVWSQSDGSLTNIWANRFENDSWGTAERIESDNSNNGTAPQIAISPDGSSAIAVWIQSDRIYANRFTAGSWGSAAAIDANTGAPTSPQIVFDGNNNAIAVWAQNNRIYENRYTATWSGAATIDDGNGTATATPQIAVDPDGDDAVVVWAQSDSTRNNIWVNTFDGSVWAGPENIESLDGDASTPDITMNAAGAAIAVWSQLADTDGSTSVTITIASPGVVSWNAHGMANDSKVVLETTGSLPTGLTAGTTYYVRNRTTNSFELSATPGGASINTSGTQSGTHSATAPRSRIYVSHLSTGDWGVPILAENTPTGISSIEPKIEMDGDGNALSIWTILADSTFSGEPFIHREVATSRYQAYRDSWSGGRIIETDTIGDQGNAVTPQISVAPDFTAIAVWSKADDVDPEDDDTNDRYSIQANIFN